MKKYLFVFIYCSLQAFSQTTFKEGIWRGVLFLTENKNEFILPFNFKVSHLNSKTTLTIYNAEERIMIDELSIKGDSINFKMPVFDSEFKTVLRNDTLYGWWLNHSRVDKNKVKFEAYYNDKTRFHTSKSAATNYSGKFEVTFNPKAADEYKAVGIFKQMGNKVTGTFLTETGDYRYLEGVVQNTSMILSCFDGSHAFLFVMNAAKNIGHKADSIAGKAFYSISGKEDFVAIRSEKFKLKDPENITVLKNPTDKIYFSFPNTENKIVSLADEKYKDKVVIIQIMGSWCPNCMDETAYLSGLYSKFNSKGLEIIALAYEKTSDFEKASRNVNRLKDRFNVKYEVLITGLTGKAKASESLPFFNSITAFPTTIILDKSHHVKSIYTGFSGPATGKDYDLYKKKTETIITNLLLNK